ncbi:MAG: M1 family metallopeptidase [Chloroflexota bacterium]
MRQIVTFTNWTGSSLNSIVLRVPAAEIGGITLHSVTTTNQADEAQISGGVLEIPVQPAIKEGETTRVEMSYSVNVPRRPGRLGLTAKAITLGNWYASLSVHRGDWDRRPFIDVGDAFYTEVADYQLEIETLQPMELAFTGVLKRREGTRWSIQAENVRDLAIVGSSSFNVARATSGLTTVTAYALTTPPERLAATAVEMLEWFSARFGHYPYSEFRAVEADLPASFGGMEYPGLVMLSSQYGPLQRGSAYEGLIAHEIAHQWFYSLVGNDQIESAWLDEGLATYAALLYYLDVAPSTGQSQLRQIESSRPVMPISTPIYTFSSDNPYFVAIYRPGAHLLHELRESMGAQVFDQVIREYVRIHSHRLATPRSFIDLLQRRTDVNLNPIARRYVDYGAFSYSAPQVWSVTLSESAPPGTVDLTVSAAFSVGKFEVWLDSLRLVSQDLGGAQGTTVRLDPRGSAPGERVLLTRVWNDEGALFEQAARITVR